MDDFESRTGNRAPERIGRYRILSRLGKGAMGVVYCARDDQIERDVALKVMMADAEGDENARERFLREARVTGRLLHRNIVTVFNMGEEDGRQYIVMELLQGSTMSDWLKNPEHTLEQKLDLMIQTCDGLAVAHAAGVVHRDVKPNNLFVLPDGSLKILDFGVARLASSSMTRSGLIVGTPDYMSPEQARGLEVDARSDVFSAAAVFYVMLSRRKPFEGPDLPMVLQHVINDDPPPLREEDAPAPLARIILKGLSKAPERRYQTMAECVAELVRFRRQFEAETRQLVAATRAEYTRLGEQEAQAVDLRARAEVGSADDVQAHATLGARYPALRATGGATPWPRVQALAISQEVASAMAKVAAEVDKLRAAVGALEAAEGAIARGDGSVALERLRAAETHLGTHTPLLRAIAARAKELVADEHAREHHVQSLLAEARQAEKDGRWDVAVARAREVLESRPDLPDAKTIVAKAQASLAAERDTREKRFQRLCDQTSAALQAGHLDQAERSLREAQQIDPGHAALGPLAERLEHVRADAAIRDEQLRQGNAAIAAARHTFDEGRHDSAVAALDAFLREHPGSPGVAAEGQRLRAEASRIAFEAAQKAEAGALADQAQTELERGEIDAALASAGRALALDQSQVLARRVHGEATTKLRELAEMATRRGQADGCLKVAVRHLASGRFDRAAQDAQRALDLQPDRSDALGLLADSQRLAVEARAEGALIAAARDRTRKIERLLRETRVSLRTGDFTGAAALAEEAARLNPVYPGTSLLLGQSRAAVAATYTGSTDETVRMDPATGQRLRRTGRGAPATKVLVFWIRVTDWARNVRRTWQATRWSQY